MPNDLDTYTLDELKVLCYDANELLNTTAVKIDLINKAIARKRDENKPELTTPS